MSLVSNPIPQQTLTPDELRLKKLKAEHEAQNITRIQKGIQTEDHLIQTHEHEEAQKKQ